MKKVLLSLLVILGLFFTTTAQMFEMYHDGNLITMGEEITVVGDPLDMELISHIALKNISPDSVNIKCRKIEIDMIEGSENYFCWAACYANFIFLSPLNVGLESDSITNEFSGHYMPKENIGVSHMCYSFFDVDNPNDSTYFYVKYTAIEVGIEDLNKDDVFVSNPYPNPANSQVTFDYNFRAGTNNVKINIHNLLGAKVKEISIFGTNGKAIIDVNDLNDGIYFYSVNIDNKIVETKRLVVSR